MSTQGRQVLLVEDDEQRAQYMMSKMKDDIVTWVHTPEQACYELLFTNPDHYDIIYLDHDAGGTAFNKDGHSPTFYPVACMIAKQYQLHYEVDKDYIDQPEETFPEIRVHSFNPSGAQRIVELLKHFGIDARTFQIADM